MSHNFYKKRDDNHIICKKSVISLKNYGQFGIIHSVITSVLKEGKHNGKIQMDNM